MCTEEFHFDSMGHIIRIAFKSIEVLRMMQDTASMADCLNVLNISMVATYHCSYICSLTWIKWYYK